jgi:hypothetical protein
MNWQKTEAMKSLFGSLSVYQPTEQKYVPRTDVWPITDTFLKDLLKLNRDTHEEVAQEAADVGTITHTFAELHSLGKITEANALLDRVKAVDKWPLIKACTDKYLEWAPENMGELVQAEGLCGYICKVHEENPEKETEAYECECFVGKFDRLDRVKGRLILRDYKTSKDIYISQFNQLSGYAMAIKRWYNLDVKGLEVIRFGKEDDTFDTLLIDDPVELKVLEAQALRCRGTFGFDNYFGNDARFNWAKKQKAKKDN